MRRSPRPAAASSPPSARRAHADEGTLVRSCAAAARSSHRRGRDHGRDQVRLRPRPPTPSSGCSARRGSSGGERPVSIVTTYLGAHALPRDRDRGRLHRRGLATSSCPPRPAEGLADAVDAFRDRIGFTEAEVSRVLAAAQAHGLPVKLHADQFTNAGGAALAARFGALSADHLEYTDDAGAAAMAAAGTVAVLLPGAFYTLRETQRPADRRLPPPRHGDGARHRLQSRQLAAHLAAPRHEHGRDAFPDDAWTSASWR